MSVTINHTELEALRRISRYLKEHVLGYDQLSTEMEEYVEYGGLQEDFEILEAFINND